MRPIIAITGPTAVGKSAVADHVALALGTDVLSADAMQVYKGMVIGTAKTPVSERLVPLRLIDIVDPSEPYSAALYQLHARSEIARLDANGQPVVFCGGTGLYLRAALDHMVFPKGEVDDERRATFLSLHKELGDNGLHQILAERDPASAACIHPHNVKRVIRALEMHDEGVSYAEQSSGFSNPQQEYEYVIFALSMHRSRLYDRINARVDSMMRQGLLEEVAGLLESGARDALTSRQAIGYKELIEYLDGSCSLEEAVDMIKQRSRRYAKRQLAWCRRDARMEWLDIDVLGIEGAVEEILSRVGLHE